MDATGRLGILRNNKGIALIYVALLISAMFGFVGLAVDAGHLYVVRGELQNAADAAALAGAWSLYRDPLDPDGAPVLNWGGAATAATEYIKLNKSDGIVLAEGTVEVGYWNLSQNILQPQTITPTNEDIPAVRVTISRADENNGGPVSNFFIKILNASFNETPVSSRPAVAMSGFPGTVPGGLVFPLALSSCMADYYFDNSSDPNFETNSPYGPVGPACETAQWTSLTDNTNSDKVISDFMTKPGTSPALSSDEPIWIATGEMNNLFNDKNAGLYVGKDVLVPIVTGNTANITKDSTNKALKIQGFATIHIVSVNNGKDPYVKARFVDYFVTYPGIRPGGSDSNTITPPVMVQ